MPTMTSNVKSLSKALPESVRRHNRAVLLHLLYPDLALTRADLARASGLTRVAVSDIVADLVAQGLLQERGPSASAGPGKRGQLLAINPSSRSIVTLDLSAPYIFRGAVMNLLGQVTARREIPLGTAHTQEAQLELVGQLCEELMAAAQAPILGVGVASPGIVNAEGVVDDTANFGWTHVDFRRFLSNRAGLEPALISVENDANSEVLAEQQYGSGGSNLLLVHMAQGLGAGLLVGGELVRGRNRAAGEIGQVKVESGGQRRLESCISVPLLAAQMEKEPGRAQAILTQAGRLLGSALSMPVGLLDLSQVAILGQAQVVNQTFISAVEEALNEAVSADFRRRVMVLRSSLGEDAALLGACATVVRTQLYSGEIRE
ncbi:NagC family transcriptional regulator [Bombiscardovia apis]|uniref:NagC family transcriptional regulator n=1 Tax=Bombiscardovia apis TaxID=2932182 RepID=A0ABN6SFE6_9BIFI|nr:ROK family transcriptional regulator [Bombiscardovia apis]BDR53973.1 NagC family transcriptional regulator [Bombiscardovia apis]